MKTLLKLLFLMTVISFISGCDKNDDLVIDESVALKSAQPHLVTVPFKADFRVFDYSDYTDDRCGGYPHLFLTMKGAGFINHMGNITTEMTFCLDASNGSYGGTECTFVAANGDELYAIVPTGQILLNEGDNADYYPTYFNDTMYFDGGTGRFEGALGKALTNAYVHEFPEDWHTDFFSTGELILEKGKR